MCFFTGRFAIATALLLVVATIEARTNTVSLKAGPHLLLDDYLIGSISNLVRKPVTLQRTAEAANPVLTSREHSTFQPFFTVIYDTTRHVFRMWYGIPTEDRSTMRSRLAYIESSDGIHWTNQFQVLDVGPIQFGASVIDEGAQFAVANERYKLGWYFENGLKLATSPDGLHWNVRPGFAVEHNHDINGIFRDSLRDRYLGILSFYIPSPDWTGKRRITKQVASPDFHRWSNPQTVISPDKNDAGETQFYAMDGFVTRGDLVVGMVKVLRDDLKADSSSAASGIGYTTVAFTRDGENWVRERVPFLDRNSEPGTWDHAHAWIDEQVIVGDEILLYYAGYKSGHKVNRFEERQIGLIKTKRDRYAGYEAKGSGLFRTPLVRTDARRLFLNVNADRGEVRVRLLSPDGVPLKHFGFDECDSIHSDSVRTPVVWSNQTSLPQQFVLEIELKDAVLYGFDLD